MGFRTGSNRTTPSGYLDIQGSIDRSNWGVLGCFPSSYYLRLHLVRHTHPVPQRTELPGVTRETNSALFV